MLEIEVTERGLVPHFRVTRDRKPARLLIFLIQEVGSEEPLWVLGPVGMVATQTTGFTMTEKHEATEQELHDFEKSANVKLGHFTSEVLEVVYGSAPQGLHQAVPEGYPAPHFGLVSGISYSQPSRSRWEAVSSQHEHALVRVV